MMVVYSAEQLLALLWFHLLHWAKCHLRFHRRQRDQCLLQLAKLGIALHRGSVRLATRQRDQGLRFSADREARSVACAPNQLGDFLAQRRYVSQVFFDLPLQPASTDQDLETGCLRDRFNFAHVLFQLHQSIPLHHSQRARQVRHLPPS